MTVGQDLTISVTDTILNIRVAIFLETPKGYVFEKSKNGYLFLIGGRVKLNEASQSAASRELFEELKLENIDTQFIGIIENFFQMDDNKKVHEINFVYKASLDQSIELNLSTLENGNNDYCYIKADEFEKHDIRPKIVKEFFKQKEKCVHLTNTE